MKICTATLSSASPYSQSRSYDRFVPVLEKEGKDDYEKRTWREKCHADAAGNLMIPAMGFKMAVDKAAKNSGRKIPGRRNATYTKHFEAGVMVLDNPGIDIAKADIEGEWVFVNADGVRGSGKRVWKCFPLIKEWTCDVVFHIADDTVSKDVFQDVLEDAGKFVGIGRFRPEKGGYYGRFKVEKVSWN